MKKVLLTGASGFIGRNLKEYLEDKAELLAPTHNELDICDEQQGKEYFNNHKINIVIHAANIETKNTNGFDMLNSMLRMYFNLAKVSNKYEKMFYFGSGAEYGRFELFPLVSESQFGNVIPKDAYGFAKYIMRKHAENSNNIYDLCLFGVYGKYEDDSRRFISNNIMNILNFGYMSLIQDALFDYLYIEDLCNIIQWFINNTPKHHVYNVCSSLPIRLSEIANIINNVSGANVALQIQKTGMQTEYTGNNSRLVNEYAGVTFTSIQEGVKKMWEYYNSKE